MDSFDPKDQSPCRGGKISTSITIDEDVLDLARAKAAKDRRSFSGYVEFLLAQDLDREKSVVLEKE